MINLAFSSFGLKEKNTMPKDPMTRVTNQLLFISLAVTAETGRRVNGHCARPKEAKALVYFLFIFSQPCLFTCIDMNNTV